MGSPSLTQLAFAARLEDNSSRQIIHEPAGFFEGHLIRIGGSIIKHALMLIKNLRKPTSVAAATLVFGAVVTLIFFPLAGAAYLSAALKAAWLGLHFFMYATFQTAILSQCLRALSRFKNQELMQKWNEGQIQPVSYFEILK